MLIFKSQELLNDVKSTLIDISSAILDYLADISSINLNELSPYLSNLRNSDIYLPGSDTLHIK